MTNAAKEHIVLEGITLKPSTRQPALYRREWLGDQDVYVIVDGQEVNVAGILACLPRETLLRAVADYHAKVIAEDAHVEEARRRANVWLNSRPKSPVTD